MKSSLLRLLAIASGLLLPEIVAAATPIYINCTGLAGCTRAGFVPFTNYLGRALTLLFVELLVYVERLGILFIMVGGAYILLSAGNEERVTKGKQTLTWAVIGIFIANSTQVLVGIIRTTVDTRIAGLDVIDSVIRTLTGSIFDLFYISLIGVALFCGMRMVLSMGKEEEFAKARQGLMYAAIGAIVINLSGRIYIAILAL